MEEDISFTLVFVKRILLAVATEIHASAQLFHLGKVILPSAIERANDEIAFKADEGFLLLKLFTLIVGFVDLIKNIFVLRLRFEGFNLLRFERDREVRIEPT